MQLVILSVRDKITKIATDAIFSQPYLSLLSVLEHYFKNYYAYFGYPRRSGETWMRGGRGSYLRKVATPINERDENEGGAYVR